MKCGTILIVEDEKEIRTILKDALEFEGYTVQTATNGLEALGVLAGINKPSLILLDLMMPIMTGWEFMEKMTEDVILATIPVVVVSAASERGRGVGAQGFCKKPVDLDVLLQWVKKFCGSPLCGA